MGCHRARARRGRAAGDASQGRHPRDRPPFRARTRALLPLSDVRSPAHRPRARVAPAGAAAGAGGGRVGGRRCCPTTSSSARPTRSVRSSTTPSRRSPELTVDSVLRGARRMLCVGAGGGGDVVGALAVAEQARGLGTPSVLGGVTWERTPIDPLPGPRRLDELDRAHRLNGGTALAGPYARGPGGF